MTINYDVTIEKRSNSIPRKQCHVTYLTANQERFDRCALSSHQSEHSDRWGCSLCVARAIRANFVSTLVQGGGPRVVVSTAAFHARVRCSVPGLGGLKETKNVSSSFTCESQYCGEPP